MDVETAWKIARNSGAAKALTDAVDTYLIKGMTDEPDIGIIEDEWNHQ